MEGKRGRVRPRQKLMAWMMSEEYSKLKEEAQYRETWNHWRSEPARSHRKFPKITTQQQWYRRRADKLLAAAARRSTKVGGGAHILSAAAARRGRRTALISAHYVIALETPATFIEPLLECARQSRQSNSMTTG